MAGEDWKASLAQFLSDWKPFLVPFAIVLLVPIVARFWKAVERYDERRDEKARIKKEAKEARKLAKQGPHYTSATVVPPPRLGHDRGSDSGSGEST